MNPKKTARLVALVALALLAGGCVWLRLLSFKNQLAKLDSSTRVVETNGLTVEFLSPVLYGEDLFMFTSQPTSRATNQSVQTWSWTYQKLPRFTNAEPGNFDLTFQTLVKDTKLTALHFPQRLLAVFPKSFLLGLLQSLGRAEIDRKRESLNVNWIPRPEEKVAPLHKAQVVELLGSPFYDQESNGVYSCLYKYQFQGVPPATGWAKFTFATNSDLVVLSEGAVGNIGWSLTVKPGQPGMQVGLALVPPPTLPGAVPMDQAMAEDYVGHYQDEGGHLLRIGHDGDLLGIDGGLSAAETAKKGWWKAWPISPGHFYGRDMEFTFVQNPDGKTQNLLVGEHGFQVSYTKISNEAPITENTIQLDSQSLSNYVGAYKATWKGAEGQIYMVSRKGNQLLWVGIPIYPTSETNFFIKLANSPLTFVKNSQGQITQFIGHYDGEDLVAQKITP